MKRSGKTNGAEPSDMSWVQTFPDCAKLFAEVGWLVFFERIQVITQKSLINSLNFCIKI